MSGYLAGFKGLWETALPRIEEPANPAAGAGYSVQLDGKYWWSLHAVTFTLVTDANAANRLVTISAGMINTNPLILGEPTVVQTAGTTVRYAGMVELGATSSATNTDVLFGLSAFPILGGRTFAISIGNVQVGDQISKLVLAFWRLPTNVSVVRQFAGETDQE